MKFITASPNITQKIGGPDPFNIKIISVIASVIVTPLCYIYNLSLTTGIFPTLLKTAKVVPIFKKGEHSNISNYRPISLLSAFSKIFESIVSQRLHIFFNKFNVLYNYQYGFRKFHSTKLALIDVMEDILKIFECKEYAVGLFLDLSKALMQ